MTATVKKGRATYVISLNFCKASDKVMKEMTLRFSFVAVLVVFLKLEKYIKM